MRIDWMQFVSLLVWCELSVSSLLNKNEPDEGNASEKPWTLLKHREVFNKVTTDQRHPNNTSTFHLGEIFNRNTSILSPKVTKTNRSSDTLDLRVLDKHGTNGDTNTDQYRTSPSVHHRFKRADMELSVLQKSGILPKHSAQNQQQDLQTEFPSQTTLLTEDTNTLGPINTRAQGPGLPNPFYPLTGESYGSYAIVLVSVTMFTTGIIANIAIMCTVCNNYYMRSVSNSLLANLALWDFFISFFCLPLVVFHYLTKNLLLGDLSCKIIPYVEVASLGVTTFTLCALCIDRFRAASNVQMYYEMVENCISTSAKLAVIWLGALLLALPELLIHQLVTEEREVPTEGPTEAPFKMSGKMLPCERCEVRISTALPDSLYVLGLTYNSARLWWHFGCYFCLPTVFTIICSVVTARKMRQVESANVRGKREQILLERRMNCMVVALAIVYGVCVIPENVCNVVLAYMATGMSRHTLDVLHLLSQMLLFCKSIVTPVLLLVLCKPFSKTFLHCCCCCLEECSSPKDSTGTCDDNDNEGTTELELSPYSTLHKEAASHTSVGAHC